MSKVITLSRTFPAWHPKKGQPTYFAEKVFASLADSRFPEFKFPKDFTDYDWHEYYNCTTPKHHTIRVGKRFKTGEKVSLRVWGDNINPKSGRKGPYHSKQIAIAPDAEVRVYDLFIAQRLDYIAVNGQDQTTAFFNKMAENDGMNAQDLYQWLELDFDPFDGQIIVFNPKIEY